MGRMSMRGQEAQRRCALRTKEREEGGREGVAICVGKRSMVNFFIFVNANNAE